MAQQYQEGQLLTGSDGRPYVVRNGVPVLDMPANGGMLITKAVTPKEQAETTSAAQRAADAVAAAPYRAQGAADDAVIKHAQAVAAQQKEDDAQAAQQLANMRRTSNVSGQQALDALPPDRRGIVQGLLQGNLPVGARGLASPAMLPYIQDAMNVDPTFSANTFAARQKAVTDLANSKAVGGYLSTVAAGVDHSREMEDAIRGLHNPSGWLAAHGGAWLNYKLNNEGLPAGNTFAQANRVYGGEMTKGIVGTIGNAGGNSALADRQEGEQSQAPTMAQDSLFAGMRTNATQLYQKLMSADQLYGRTMGGQHIPNIVTPEQAQQLVHLMRLKDDGTEGPIPSMVTPQILALAGINPNDSGSGSSSNGPSAPPGGSPSGTGIGSGPGGMTIDPARQAVANQLQTMLASGRPDDEITAFAKGAGNVDMGSVQANLDFRRKNPNYRGGYDASALALTPRQAPPLSFSGGTSPLGNYFMSAGNALTGNFLDNMTADPSLARAGLAGSNAANPTSTILGDLSGAGLAAAGSEIGAGAALGRLGLNAAKFAAPLGDALYGGLSGAGAADDGNRLTGAAIGGGLGVAGGMFGRNVVAPAISGIASGITDPAVNYLRNAGVPLTAGQAVSQSGLAGRAVKGLEDKLTSTPLVGDAIRARRLEGMQGFNQAAFDQGLAPIGLSTNGLTNEAGVDAALNATGQGYRNALGNVSLQGDQPFRADVAAANQFGSSAPTYGGDFSAIMKDQINPIVAGSPTINGDQFQQLKRTLGGYQRQYAQIAQGTPMVPPAPLAGRVSDAFGGLESSLDGLVARQAPDVAPAYANANTAYRNVKVIQDAVNRARNGTRVGEPGTFAPSQLSDAAASNSRMFGGTQGTTNQPFFDLTRYGQAVLPSSIPDSGTAGRLAALALPATLGGTGFALGGTDGAERGSLGGLGLAGALALGGTKVGQRALTSALLDRPQIARNFGAYLANNPQYLGMFGAGAAPLLAQ